MSGFPLQLWRKQIKRKKRLWFLFHIFNTNWNWPELFDILALFACSLYPFFEQSTGSVSFNPILGLIHFAVFSQCVALQYNSKYNELGNKSKHWTVPDRVLHLDVEDTSEELLAPALLCHKETACRIQSPLPRAIDRKMLLAPRCFFMA